ncbi:MAG: hypothetical protein QOH98_1457 [Methylobacteriaceae bacterium]|jgi:hypothetical protein|nr:hypothetical protein [Methylobacteriaceae bacterium]
MRALTACLVLVALSGCAGELPPPAGAVAPYCDVARPIYWSAKDTRATKEQADRENAKWKRLCAGAAKPLGP